LNQLEFKGGNAMQRNLFLITLLLFCFFFSELAAGVDAAFLQKVNETEQLAYQDISNGKIRDGLRQIIQLFREAPMNDSSYIEPLMGPYQLFSFALSKQDSLIWTLTSPENLTKQEPLLNPSEYPGDQLLLALAYAQPQYSGTSMAISLINQSKELLYSPEKVPQLVGVGLLLLILPEHQEILEINTDIFRAISIKFMEVYGDRTLHQFFVEMQALYQLEQCRGKNKSRLSPSEASILNKMEEWGIDAFTVYSLSPGLNCVSVGLPSMNLRDVNLDTLQVWADILRAETDTRTRYMLLSFLRLGLNMSGAQDFLREVLEEVSSKRAMEADGILAKCMLNNLDAREHRVKELYQRAIELSQLGVLPCVVSVRSLYAEQSSALWIAYGYFKKYGWYDYAIQLSEYLEQRQWMEFEAFNYDPIYISLRKIYADTSHFRFTKNEEALKSYYLDIAEHTPSPELRSKVIGLSKNPLADIRPAPESPIPMGKILLDRAKRTVLQQQANQENDINTPKNREYFINMLHQHQSGQTPAK